MKQFYMDTNVFIASLKRDDPFHSEARTMAKSMNERQVRAVTSVFTLLEVASVSGRLYGSGPKGFKSATRQVFIIKTLKRLAALNPELINIAGDVPVGVKGIDIILPSIFNESILLSLKTAVRSLDLIHLTAARHAKRANVELGAFVTGDNELLSRKKELSDIIAMPILSPAEYVKAVGLTSR